MIHERRETIWRYNWKSLKIKWSKLDKTGGHIPHSTDNRDKTFPFQWNLHCIQIRQNWRSWWGLRWTHLLPLYNKDLKNIHFLDDDDDHMPLHMHTFFPNIQTTHFEKTQQRASSRSNLNPHDPKERWSRLIYPYWFFFLGVNIPLVVDN